MKEQIEEMRNEQIGEMAKALMNAINEKQCHTSMRALAEALYNAGYRKQKEGVWIKHEESIWEHRYWCSVCNFYLIGAPTPYCQSCGARMKGGDKE